MLAHFQSLYPKGSIISHLMQIHEGKYLVRVEVQIDGVTRATGMAGAETLEAAEDQARSRALMVLGMQSNVSQPTPSVPEPQPQPQVSKGEFKTSYASTIDVPTLEPKEAPTISSEVKTKSDRSALTPPLELDEPEGNLGLMSSSPLGSEPSAATSYNNVKTFTPRSSTPTAEKTTKTVSPVSEPVNHADNIAKIDVEMERLGWTKEQGREHLIKTYGKRARSLLNDQELLDFLRYLESQPTPLDPLAGF